MADRKNTALVLDDEMLIAMDLEEMLTDLGYAEVWLASSLPEARVMLESGKPDVAVIDFRIHGKTCESIASALRGMDVPTVVHSGNPYEVEYHGEFLGTFPWLMKPTTKRELGSAITIAIDQTKLIDGSDEGPGAIITFPETI